MAKVSVYLNKHSSKSQHDKWRESLSRYLFRHQITFKEPVGLDNLAADIRQDIRDKVDMIFGIGGDGTMNALVQNLVGTKIKLLMIPAGTANDAATELGIRSNMGKIMKVFQHKSSRVVDVIEINNRYMLTNGGIGLPHQVANGINEARVEMASFQKLLKYLGPNMYVLMLLKNLGPKELPYREYQLEYELDGEKVVKRVNSAMILVNNQPIFGGRFPVAPLTENNDGTFNLTVFNHPRKSCLVKCAAKMFIGKYPYDDKQLISVEIKELKIKALDGRPIDFFGDGENLVKESELNIKLKAKAIEMCSFNRDHNYWSSYSLDEVDL